MSHRRTAYGALPCLLASALWVLGATPARGEAGAESEGYIPDVRSAPEELQQLAVRVIEGIAADRTAEERERLAYYLTVGSVNLDYRSMMLNAEVMITVTGWAALNGFVDFVMLPGLCEWPDTQEELDALLPPPGGMRRKISNFLKILL